MVPGWKLTSAYSSDPYFGTAQGLQEVPVGGLAKGLEVEVDSADLSWFVSPSLENPKSTDPKGLIWW